MKTYLKNKTTTVGMVLVLCMVLAGVLAPLIAPHSPYTQILDYSNKPPGFKGEVVLYRLGLGLPVCTVAIKSMLVLDNTVDCVDTFNRHVIIDKNKLLGEKREDWHKRICFFLGSDNLGRDILSRVLYGIRISLFVGFFSSMISLFVGVTLGALAGYYGGIIEMIIMRITDVMYGFPILLFLIAITTAFEPSLIIVFCSIGFVSWPGMARVTRGQVKQVKENEFVKATKVLGFKKSRTLWKHIVPNSLTPVLVMYALSVSGAIMAESSLSFLGLGAQPPVPSLGSMINAGIDFVTISPWISIAPGFVIASIVFGFNMFSDGLKSSIDPITKK